MQVCWFVTARWNRVHIEVIDSIGRGDDCAQARLFAGFAERDAPDIRVAIGMPAGLQPLPELAVMHEQHKRTRAVDDPCAARDMAERERPFERFGMTLHECAKLERHRALARVGWDVAPDFFEQGRTTGGGRGALFRVHRPGLRSVTAPFMRGVAAAGCASGYQVYMSRAFMKEQDDQAEPNEHLVASRAPTEEGDITPEGFASLQRRLANATDPGERVALERQIAASTVIEHPEDRGVAAFGATVVVTGDRGAATTYRIVGLGEIDVARNAVGVHSPLAQALLGAHAGDIITWHRPAGDRPLRVTSISYPPASKP